MTSLTYGERATRIVDRVLPKLRSAHGWYDPEWFVEAARREGQRQRLYWRTFARLRAKAEGGVPHITIPSGCEHLWGPGTAMFDVAEELEGGTK